MRLYSNNATWLVLPQTPFYCQWNGDSSVQNNLDSNYSIVLFFKFKWFSYNDAIYQNSNPLAGSVSLFFNYLIQSPFERRYVTTLADMPNFRHNTIHKRVLLLF